jgi:hypothetical protein
MNELLARLRATFVVEAPGRAPARASARAIPSPRVALLASREHAVAAGAALLGDLLAAGSAPAGALCVWAGAEPVRRPWTMPGRGAGRRLAARLAARDLEVATAGRMVRVTLPADAQAALAATLRAGAATPGPVVLAVAVPRDRTVDEALALQDAVAVVRPPGDDAALTAAAEVSLAGLGVPVAACELAGGSVERRLAECGLPCPGPLRRGLAPIVERIA